jgi:hypothetical protein
MAFKILDTTVIDNSRNFINAASVGIGTTNPTSVLHVIGNTLATGIITASRFVSNVAQGTAPISVASSTRVDNLNADYLDGNDSTYYTTANNLTGTAPGSVISQSSGLTITGNLSVSGNVSVSGTSFLLSAQSLRITDRDITLGVTTDAFGNDVSNDTTANHGGIAIASTEGSPILNIPQQAGINTDPSTYKQLMWIRQGNFSGMGTDAWVFNYGVSIGNTTSVQNLSRLTVGAGFTVFDTYLDATDIRARNITAVNNINSSGIVTAITFSGQINSGVGTITTLGSTSGTITNLTGTAATITNINSSGIHTAAQYYVGATTVLSTVSSQIRLAGIATIDATTKATLERELAFAPNDFDSLNVSGISTLKSTTLIGAGTSTGTAGQVFQVTGISSGAYIGGNLGIGSTNPGSKLSVVGDGNFSGIVTTGSLKVNTGLYDNNGNVGTAGSIIVATASGFTWQSVTSGTSAIAGINVSQDDTGVRYPLLASGTNATTTAQYVDTNGLAYNSNTNCLGIGSIAPTSKLDVLGDVKVSGIVTTGNLKVNTSIYDNNNNVGSASSVLTAGTGGQLVWAPIVGTGGAIAGINVSQDDTGVRYPLLASGANVTTTAQYIDNNGLVYNSNTNCLGIGSTAPTSKLDIIGDVRVSGIVTAGDFNSNSDRKLKTNIEVIPNPIEKVLQINGVSFNWKENGKAAMGVIAQEIEAVLPELVSDTDPKTVNYNGLIGLLIECVKDQQKQIDELKGKL